MNFVSCCGKLKRPRMAAAVIALASSLVLLLGLIGPGTALAVTGVPPGYIIALAGNGTSGYNGDGIAATSAKLATPEAVAVDSQGNVYIADTNNGRIRMVPEVGGTYFGQTMTAGDIYTLAGTTSTSGFSGDGGLATVARLSRPQELVLDSNGNFYFADTGNGRVRVIANETGTLFGVPVQPNYIYTIAGNGQGGATVDAGDGGYGYNAELGYVNGVALDGSGNLYLSCSNNGVIRKLTPGGIISTVAGTGTNGYNGDGMAATSAELNYPHGLATDKAGNLYIADEYNHRVRVIAEETGALYGIPVTAGDIYTVAGTGSGGVASSGNGGLATNAVMYYPMGVAVDSNGNLYVSDAQYCYVWQVNPYGYSNYVAGNGTGNTSPTYVDDVLATTSGVKNYYLAVDSANNLYLGGSNMAPSMRIFYVQIQSVTGITLNDTSDTITAGNSDTLTATVAPSNATNPALAWTSSDTSVATVVYSGASCTVNAVAPGSATITAAATDGSGVSATCAVTVAPPVAPSLTATPAAAPGSSTGATAITAAPNTSGDTLAALVSTGSISAPNVGDQLPSAAAAFTTGSSISAVAGDYVGVYELGSSGTVVAFSQIGPLAASQINTTTPVTGVTLSKSSDTITANNTDQLTATVAPTNAINPALTWVSDNTSVATVVYSGTSCTVTAVAPGSANITAATTDGSGLTATCAVTVTGGPTTSMIITVNGGAPVTVTAADILALNPANTLTRYSSTSFRYYTCLGASFADILSHYTSLTGSEAQSVSAIFIGSDNYKVSLTQSQLFGTRYYYPSSGDQAQVVPIIATEDDHAITTDITQLTSSDCLRNFLGQAYVGDPTLTDLVQNIKEIDVTYLPVTGVTLSKTGDTITAGATDQLTATVAPSGATNQSAVWTSSNTSVAAVDQTGLVTAVAAGSATITAATADGGLTATCAVTVQAAATTITGSAALGSFSGALTGQIQVYVDGTKQATTDTGGAYTISGVSPGSHLLEIKSPGYLEASGTITVTSSTSIPAVALIAGDVNGDGVINIDDYTDLVQAYGSTSGGSNWNAAADFNRDGVINIDDCTDLVVNYGKSAAQIP